MIKPDLEWLSTFPLDEKHQRAARAVYEHHHPWANDMPWEHKNPDQLIGGGKIYSHQLSSYVVVAVVLKALTD